MNLSLIAEQILPFLEEPKTMYELAAIKEMSISSIYQKLKILEAAKMVKKIQAGKGVLWQKIEQIS